jgi:ribosomal protein S8E
MPEGTVNHQAPCPMMEAARRDAPQSTSASETGGPLRWYTNLEMEGGPPLARPVFSLTFMGGNVSQKEVSLKTANIVSAINGKRVQLEIIARDDQGKNEVTPIEEINLIPPVANMP